MKRALISVTNKDGVVDFAKGLVELGFDRRYNESFTRKWGFLYCN